MKALLTAINTYWDATSALVTDIGPLSINETPPGTTGAYVVMNVIVAPKTWNYGSASYAEPMIQFTLRDSDSLTGLTKIEAMTALLDDKVFTISGKQNFGCVRQGDAIPEPSDPEQDEAGLLSFGWIVTYSLANT